MKSEMEITKIVKSLRNYKSINSKSFTDELKYHRLQNEESNYIDVDYDSDLDHHKPYKKTPVLALSTPNRYDEITKAEILNILDNSGEMLNDD